MKLFVKTKMGGRPYNISRAHKLLNCINYCNLLDLGFKGSRYTWSNHRFREGLILERLDRYCPNKEWLFHYENVGVTHLPRTHSDHSPILLNLNKTHTKYMKKNLFVLKLTGVRIMNFRF